MSPYQRLAVAVLVQAYQERGRRYGLGPKGARFFAPNEWCQFWCDVAGIDPDWLCDMVHLRARSRRDVY